MSASSLPTLVVAPVVCGAVAVVLACFAGVRTDRLAAVMVSDSVSAVVTVRPPRELAMLPAPHGIGSPASLAAPGATSSSRASVTDSAAARATALHTLHAPLRVP